MSATAIALSTLLARCAPDVGPRTMTAIVRVESDGRPLAIHDNTTDRMFAPRTVGSATASARTLIAAGHSIDLGLVQINSRNLAGLRMTVREMFDPCTNLRAGAIILTNAYERATTIAGPGALALRRAIGAYNSGSIYAGGPYVERILAAAGLSPEGTGLVPDLEPSVVVARDPVIALPAPERQGPTRTQPTARPRIVTVLVATPKPIKTADPYGSSILVTTRLSPAVMQPSVPLEQTAPAATSNP